MKGSGTLDSCSSKGAQGYGRKKAEIEKLWQELFLDPTKWQDHRLDKVNPRFPDFKHKNHTHKALWLNYRWIPPWVKEKLAALSPGTIQLSPFSWNQRLSKYAQAGQYKKTIDLFQQMQKEVCTPDRFTFFPVLKACTSLGLLDCGRYIHAMMQPDLKADFRIGSSLVDMYAKCGSIEEANRVFNQMPTRHVVAWNAMIFGYVKYGEGQKALELFEEMQKQGVHPDPVTYVGILNSCASLLSLEQGRHVHREILRKGFEGDIVVQTSLIDMYAKCGSIEEAEQVFKQMATKNVAAWTAMILGYVKCGEGRKALELFEEMQRLGVNPDCVTFVAVLSACSSVAALESGRHAHEEIILRGYEKDVILGNCLIDMYTKCGSIEEAEKVFNGMPARDVVAWTAMIIGYASHGYARKALNTFRQMQKIIGVDGIAFISLLSACSHGGLVDEGLEYFKSMSTVYNILPTVEHYGCVVDLLGRVGRLFEAEELIMSMPKDPNTTVWISLLSACRAHANLELGERCVKQLLELDPENSAGFVLLADIYVAAGNWDSSTKVNQDWLGTGLKKAPGFAWIEVNKEVSSLTDYDCEQPQIKEIRAKLKRLLGLMKNSKIQGLLQTPDLSCVV